MSIYRKNLITNDWVIFAPNRAKRPVELGKKEETDNVDLLRARAAHREDCPFCPGNEKPDEEEVLHLQRDGRWQVRVLANKYASVDRNARPEAHLTLFHKEVEGFGIHDVIIDHPRHNATLALMPVQDIADLYRACLQRYTQLSLLDEVRHVVLFKNQGFKAGGSLEHPHSQIYGLPVIPFETRVRLAEVEKYHDFNNTCLMCALLEHEREEQVRIIYENAHFTVWVPYAALSPFHIWIVPRRHSPSFRLITDPEISGLADAVKQTLGRLFSALRNPDYNYVFQSLARFERETEYYHWYISLIPQLKRRGGIEYAGGLFVNTVMPEDAATELRAADISGLDLDSFYSGTAG